MTNRTPEVHNWLLNATVHRRCGWCASVHVANVACTCKEPCDAGWCPAAVDLEDVAL